MNHLIFRGIVVLFSSGLSVANAAPSVAKAPCSDTGQPGLKSCQELLISGTPAIPAAHSPTGTDLPALPGVLTQLTSSIQNQINSPSTKGYYQHVDPSYDFATQQAGAQKFGPTLCNLIPGQFTPSAETSTNQVGESCGKPIQIEIHYSVSTIAGCATSDPRPVPVTVHKEFIASNPLSSPGLLEDGYARGSIVQATTCFYKQVSNEIKNNHQITVNDINGSPSPCASLLTQYQGLSSSLQNSIDALKSKLTGQANFGDIINCKKSWDTSGSDNPDVGPLRQSAQQLCAARTLIENVFSHLAACEILARSQAAYISLIGSQASQQSIQQMIQTQIATPCGNQCTAGASWCNIPSDTSVQNCTNTCYQQKMPDAFKNFINGHWASDGSKCDLSMNDSGQGLESGFLFIGMLGWAKRRGRRRRPSRLKTVLRKAITWAALGALSGLSIACGGGDSHVDMPAQSPNGPCAGTTETQDPACCPGNLAGAAPPPQCSTHTPGDGGINFHQAGAAAAADKADTALNAANRLLSPTGNALSTKSGPLAQGAQATAGGIVPNGPAHPNLASGSGPSVPGIGGAAPGPGNSGSAGGFGGGSGSNSGATGGLKTGDLSDSVAATASPGPTSGDGAQYTSGNGGSGSSGANANAGGLFARGPGGIGDGTSPGPTETTFSPDMNGTSGKEAVASEDPADYFTRVGMDENLFKVVEKRYRATTLTWVRDVAHPLR